MAIIAVFGALQAILSLLPFSITVGVSGQITLGLVGGSLIGILFGPLTGGLAVFIGSLAGGFLNPAGAIFGILSPVPPFLGAVAGGCVRIKKAYLSGVIILGSLLVFYANPVGMELLIYPFLSIAALLIAFSPLGYFAGSALKTNNTKIKRIFGIAIAAFIGVLADHMAGSALAIWYLPPIGAEAWLAITFVYPVERILAATLVTITAFPVFIAIERAKLTDLVN